MKKLVLAALVLLSTGCAMPSTTVRSVDTRPSISVARASDRAELYVDGVKMGRAIDFEAPNQLTLDAGTHRISLMDAGTVTFEQTIFIESEHKTITVR